MTVRSVNVTLGTASVRDGSIPITAVSHGGSSATGHVSIVYDDSVVNTQAQIVQGIRAALATMQGNANLK